MSNETDLSTLSPAKRALYELRSARARIEELESARSEPIAVVGIGLRFPGGANDPDGLWQLLDEGRDAITTVPEDRWNLDELFDADPDAPGKMYTRHGGFLDGVDRFDARFFGVSPREAVALDPQHRLLLEVAWEALEHAGIDPSRIGTEAGVFVALSNGDYGRLVYRGLDRIDAYASTGNVFAVAAGRLSYFLGFEGPSIAVDTACSGSLVAVHLACQSLRAGECRTALAGGANLILTPELNVNFSKARMMAPDGRCKTFDAAADGYVRGEGVGVIVLRRLSDAQRRGDRILAVIRGSAVNQDGRSGGLTVPNGPSQEAVIRAALQAARVEPDSIDYVEAHGTGTSLGDPIEAHALAAVFAGRPVDRPLVLGSLKTNIGHLEATAGVAGVIKVVLSLQHERLPPHLHFKRLNPHIDFGGLPVEIPTAGRPWPRGDRPRRAGVSSFGFGGTNAHVVVEEAPVSEEPPRTDGVEERPLQLLPISAKSESALEVSIARYRECLASSTDAVADLCWSAATGRAGLPFRAAFIGRDRDDLIRQLDAPPLLTGTTDTRPEIAFLFTGQGCQRAGMGQELYRSEPVFRRELDRAAALFDRRLERPLFEVLWGSDPTLIDQTEFTQPALFSVQWALAEMWKSWGIRPAAVFGHSAGEYVALAVAGVWSFEDGFDIIVERGRAMASLGPGFGMASVRATLDLVGPIVDRLAPWVSIAAINGPESLVLSGRLAELDEACEEIGAAGARVKRLAISHAGHSIQMESMADAFARKVAAVPMVEPGCQIVSSVTGMPVGLEELSRAEYWRRQVREAVRFTDAMETLDRAGFGAFLEIGPAPVLLGMGQECLAREALWLPSLRKDRGEWEQILESLGQLHVRGVDVDWEAFDAGRGRRRVQLPTYPFERARYWIDAATDGARPLPVRDATIESARRQASQCGFDLSLDRYRMGWDVLDRLTTAYIRTALVQLGAFQVAGATEDSQSLSAATGIKPEFDRLMQRWLDRLAELGLLTRTGSRYQAGAPLTALPLEPLLAEADQVFGPDRAMLDWVVACGTDLTGYLTGRISTLETLFPGGSFERAENIYQHAPMSRYFAEIGRAAFEAVVRTRRGPVRVVEIGAGTAATSAALMPVLPDDGSEYHVTDVSDFFLNHGREKFAGIAGVRFGKLDIEKPGGPQGYPDGSFDVVVATNVFHATRDLRDTLRRAKALLGPGGVLILCEVTEYLSWFDITTGLIEGWQLFEDGIRGDHPLIAESVWRGLLEEVGFDGVVAFPEAGSPAEVLGQHVLLGFVGGTPTRRESVVEVVETTGPTDDQVAAADAGDDILAELAGASDGDRIDILVGLVRRELARALRVADPGSLERKRGLVDFGIDSLMAVELRNRLAKALRLERPLPATLVFDHPNIEAIARFLDQETSARRTGPAPTPTAAPTPAEPSVDLDRMSDDEAEALLLRKLQSL